MKKMAVWLMVMLLPLVLIGCSSNSSSSSQSSASDSSRAVTGSSSSTAKGATHSSAGSSLTNQQSNANTTSKTNTPSEPKTPNSRMIVYNAQLSIEVKDYNQFQKAIEDKVQGYQGYIVDLSQDHNQDALIGHLTIRIPQSHFYTFLNDVKKDSNKVVHSSISGEDVTKQYVDLAAHLKAKQLVEARLQSFMKKATDTTDLLKISDELGTVQADIESIKGQMNYLKNQSDLSTITLNVTENKVTVPTLDTANLNTWQKAQKAFMMTIQGLTSFGSWLLVFIIGAAPVLVILVILAIIYLVWRRKRNKKKE